MSCAFSTKNTDTSEYHQTIEKLKGAQSQSACMGYYLVIFYYKEMRYILAQSFGNEYQVQLQEASLYDAAHAIEYLD